MWLRGLKVGTDRKTAVSIRSGDSVCGGGVFQDGIDSSAYQNGDAAQVEPEHQNDERIP